MISVGLSPPRMRGPFPSRARWYLASLLLLAVSGTALHFRLQAHVQQQARQMVDDWLATVSGQAGRVRYQLLRGDISISNIHLTRAGMRVHVGRVWLHAPLSVLGAGHLVFSDVRLKGLTVDFSPVVYTGISGSALQRRVLAAMGLLRMTRRVRVEGLLLRAQALDGSLLLATGRMRFDARGVRRSLRLHLETAGGAVDGRGSWQWDEAGHVRMQTSWQWSHLSMPAVLAHLGLARWLHGDGDGHLTWQADWDDNTHDISGQLTVSGTAAKSGSPASADFTVSARHDRVTARLACKALPLHDISSPTLAGRHLARAVFSGEIRAESAGLKGWSYALEGSLADVVYAADGLPGWHAAQATVSGLTLRMPGHELRIRKLAVTDSEVVLLLPRGGEPGGHAPGWHLTVEAMQLQGLRVRLQLPDDGGFLRLPALQGRGRLRAGGGITLDLHSSAQEGQQWRIRGRGSLKNRMFAVDVTAGDVPLVQLRPLLPDLGWLGLGAAPELHGQVTLDLRVQGDDTGVYASGDVSASSLALAAAGTRVSAARMQLVLQRTGPALVHIGSIRLDGWRYQMPLMPMDAAPSVAPPERAQSRQWRLDDIELNEGTISVGGGAAWMRRVRVRVHGLYAGNDAPVSVQARLGEGSLQLGGTVDVFSPQQRFAMRCRLRHALPFFLGDWLAISGVPRITRGRWNADLRVKTSGPEGGYRGVLYLGLYHGQLESGVFPDDALLKLAGYSMRSIFHRLRTRSRWWLKVPLAGAASDFGLRALGTQVLAEIRRQMAGTASADPLRGEEAPIALEHVRLHDGKPLSLNERMRLRRLLSRLKEQRGFIIDLQPQLGSEPLDSGMIARIRHTQAMIERYLRRQGIGTMRIFPVWPQARHRTGEVGGILVRVLPG